MVRANRSYCAYFPFCFLLFTYGNVHACVFVVRLCVSFLVFLWNIGSCNVFFTSKWTKKRVVFRLLLPYNITHWAMISRDVPSGNPDWLSSNNCLIKELYVKIDAQSLLYSLSFIHSFSQSVVFGSSWSQTDIHHRTRTLSPISFSF